MHVEKNVFLFGNKNGSYDGFLPVISSLKIQPINQDINRAGIILNFENIALHKDEFRLNLENESLVLNISRYDLTFTDDFYLYWG
jgi:hypothetical protein